MNFPADLKYTESHEWVRVEADGTLTIGITDHAQDALGDIVFLELPEVGKSVGAGDALAVVESGEGRFRHLRPGGRRSHRRERGRQRRARNPSTPMPSTHGCSS